MSPPSSRLRVRENRSPSKVYEDTLIIERKIRSFGLFSEDLSGILMLLLKDNEEMKNIIKVGFKEIEREMSEIDESNKNEIKQRTKENLELKHLLNSRNNELEEQLIRMDKEVKMNIFNLKTNLDSTIENLKKDIDRQIDSTLDDKIPDIDSRLNDMSAKMSLVFTNQDEKVKILERCLEQSKEEIHHLINKTNDDLNKVIESNLEDTTRAVVNLRKDVVEEMKMEKKLRIDDKAMMEGDIKHGEEELMKKINEHRNESSIELSKVETKFSSLESKMNAINEELQATGQDMSSEILENKRNIESSLKDIGRME